MTWVAALAIAYSMQPVAGAGKPQAGTTGRTNGGLRLGYEKVGFEPLQTVQHPGWPNQAGRASRV
jgi:hypothetical protein